MTVSLTCGLSAAISAAAPQSPAAFRWSDTREGKQETDFYFKYPAPRGIPEKATTIFMIL